MKNKRIQSIAMAYGINETPENRVLDIIWSYENGGIGNCLMLESEGTNTNITKYRVDTATIIERFIRVHNTRKWLLEINVSMADRLIISFTRPESEKSFPMLTVTRTDIRGLGYDDSQLTDKDMAEIAWKAGEHEGIMEHYWDNLRDAMTYRKIRRLSAEERENLGIEDEEDDYWNLCPKCESPNFDGKTCNACGRTVGLIDNKESNNA